MWDGRVQGEFEPVNINSNSKDKFNPHPLSVPLISIIWEICKGNDTSLETPHTLCSGCREMEGDDMVGWIVGQDLKKHGSEVQWKLEEIRPSCSPTTQWVSRLETMYISSRKAWHFTNLPSINLAAASLLLLHKFLLCLAFSQNQKEKRILAFFVPI